MRYYSILQQAFKLVTRHINLCGFGFVLFGGFNLFLINFFAFQTQGQWKTWPHVFQGPMILVGIIAMAGIYFGLNVVKVWFITLVHAQLHKQTQLGDVTGPLCDLCLLQMKKVIPYTKYAGRALLASSVTIAITGVLVIVTNEIITKIASHSMVAVIVNVGFILIATTLLGAWNLFTSYFIVLHGMSFELASKAAIDLFTLRFRRIVEFLFLTCLFYFAATLVGNAFINVWNHGFMDEHHLGLRLFALLLFVVWFLFINTLFNTSFVIFFDELVKTTKSPQPLAHGQPSPNIVN